MSSTEAIHLGQQLDESVLDSLADFVCGDDADRYPTYRSSMYLTKFFQGVGINVTHHSETRKWWTLDVLRALGAGDLEKVILRLVDLREYKADKAKLGLAFRSMNDILAIENLGVHMEGTRAVLVRTSPISFSAADLSGSNTTTEDEFLRRQFTETLSASDLKIDPVVGAILQDRIDEAQACARSKVPLGTIFLLGSTLEGLLIAVALTDMPRFMTASAAPKTQAGNARHIYDWKLAELIDVYHEVGVLSLDVKKFSHVLRDFRNFIHPYHQMAAKFSPDQHTVDICWQVFRAAFAQLQAA